METLIRFGRENGFGLKEEKNCDAVVATHTHTQSALLIFGTDADALDARILCKELATLAKEKRNYFACCIFIIIIIIISIMFTLLGAACDCDSKGGRSDDDNNNYCLSQYFRAPHGRDSHTRRLYMHRKRVACNLFFPSLFLKAALAGRGWDKTFLRGLYKQRQVHGVNNIVDAFWIVWT